MKLELWYPVKPFRINQVFGNNPLNPDGTSYYSRFLDSQGQPEKGHMGLDMLAYHGQPVYAPVDGVAQFARDEHGGEGVYIKCSDGINHYSIVHWHLIGDTDPKYPNPLPPTGQTNVKVGQLIGYADNTGAPFESSGDHLHFGLIPVDQNGKTLFPSNGYNGCVDPLPYFNGYYAVDSGTVLGIFNKILSLLKLELTIK